MTGTAVIDRRYRRTGCAPSRSFPLQSGRAVRSSSPMAATENRRVSARATSVVGIAILCSRILGLVREMVIASLFGASRNLDAFLTALK